MGANTKIAWCDHTFNPWIGCTKVSSGCAHCYAENLMDIRYGKVEWGPNGTRHRTSNDNWRKPLKKWNPYAEATGVRAKVFCASLADVFEDWRGPVLDSRGNEIVVQANGSYCTGVRGPNIRPLNMDDLRRDLFLLIDRTPWLDWLLLTKRPDNIRKMWIYPDVVTIPSDMEIMREAVRRQNVWLGTSVSDQQSADKQIPMLLDCDDMARVLFLSADPLLGPIDMTVGRCDTHNREFIANHVAYGEYCTECAYGGSTGELTHLLSLDASGFGDDGRISWVIVAGESGPHARPCEIDWIRSIRDQCAEAGVPCFIKQLGANCPGYRFRDANGGDWDEWPEDLRVRQFPEVIQP